MDRIERTYKNELLVRYAKELIELDKKGENNETDSIEISDFELLHFCVNNIVFKNNDLESLLDSYLFCVGNEELGQHENVYGDVKAGISGVSLPNKEISVTYHSFQMVLFGQIDYVLSQSSDEIQRDFFERILNDREKIIASDLQAAKNQSVRLKDKENAIKNRYPNLTRENANLQHFYDQNYTGREIIVASKQLESIKYLITHLGEDRVQNQSNVQKR